MKKHHLIVGELKKSRPVLGFLEGKCTKSTTNEAGPAPDFPSQEKAHSGLRTLTPFDFDEAGVDDLVNVALRSDDVLK